MEAIVRLLKNIENGEQNVWDTFRCKTFGDYHDT